MKTPHSLNIAHIPIIVCEMSHETKKQVYGQPDWMDLMRLLPDLLCLFSSVVCRNCGQTLTERRLRCWRGKLNWVPFQLMNNERGLEKTPLSAALNLAQDDGEAFANRWAQKKQAGWLAGYPQAIYWFLSPLTHEVLSSNQQAGGSHWPKLPAYYHKVFLSMNDQLAANGQPPVHCVILASRGVSHTLHCFSARTASDKWCANMDKTATTVIINK